MPFESARKAGRGFSSHTGKCIGLAALILFFGCENLQNAVANGDTRTISFHHLHTGEDLTITYKKNGRYDEAAMQKINWELRDWRRDEAIKMDPHLIDLVWEAQRESGGKAPIQVVCGYRSPATNAMLRAKTRGVAKFSQHMLGKAMDFYLSDVPLAKLREVGLKLERGGVGYYPTSGSPFVHLDTGNVRHWPKVSREYLAKIFPDGKTVHIPADGRPMPGYQQALAEIKARGDHNVSSITMASASETAPMASGDAVKKFFAKIFGRKDESGDDEETQITTVATRPVQVEEAKPASHAKPHAVAAANIPLPRARPNAEIAALTAKPAKEPVQVASLDDRAPLPPEITGTPAQSLALGYAPDSIFSPRAISAAPDPMISVSEPRPQPQPAPRRTSAPVHTEKASAPERKTVAVETYADAAQPPASLMDNRMMQFAAELHRQDPAIAMMLAAPGRVTIRSEFAAAPEQPALSRFAGPAVVALPTVFFGQSAMLSPNRVTRAD
ncbi:MAG TPA: DUF882 domain-containing protein [Xanthobacteraceae bacterium]|nr:DUF882 domain-containing protein [Xanthobacteraceae bacterium]